MIAVCVGHSRRVGAGRAEGGAWTHDGKVSEWQWNDALARAVVADLHDRHGLDACLVNDYGCRSYGEAMRWLAGELRADGVGLAVELHFNSASETANGHEWLHHAGSVKGRLAATELHLAMCRAFPGIRARGVKTPISGRGEAFLSLTHCPAVIAEPFFGSNKHDWATMYRQPEKLATALAAGLAAALRRM